MLWKRPSERDRESVPGAPARGSGTRAIARVGAPSLIALASALALLALLVSALFVPGFVRQADADTTSTTETAPAEGSLEDSLPAEEAPGDAVPADGEPAVPIPDEPGPALPDLPDQTPGRKLVALPWGNGAGQVGLVQPAEGLTRGPEALAVAPDGRIAILDSVNSRLVLLAEDGSYMAAVPVSLKEPRFLAVDENSILVLDADTDRQLVCLDWQGVLLRSTVLPEMGDVVTGLFATTDGPCIEVAHDSVFLIEFTDSASRTNTPEADTFAAGSGAVDIGKPAKSGRSEKSAAASVRATGGRPVDHDISKTVKITFKADEGIRLKRFEVDKKTQKQAQTQSAKPRFPASPAIEHLISVDGDGSGGLIIGARLLQEHDERIEKPSLIIGRVSAGRSGDPAPVISDTLILCDSPYAYLGQPYVVAPDGRVFRPSGSDEGYTITIYTLPLSTGVEETQP